MGFYIIEINDKYKQVVLLSAEGELYCKDVAGLMPYTEPDMEQVRKEAYKDGCDAGFGRKIDASYQEGLSDAWEAARKIIHMPEADLLNLFTECYAAVCTSVQVFLKYDASECIEKIRQYERGKEEQIHIGDEVIATAGKAVVIEVIDDGQTVRYMYPDTITGRNKACNVTRTGRHFPEIAEVLRKIKETECSV